MWPSGLRQRSAKPSFIGSNPIIACFKKGRPEGIIGDEFRVGSTQKPEPIETLSYIFTD